jgi:serine/threonine protein kinase
MGSVYEVVDETTAAPRALKVMLASVLGDADQRARFALEARVTGSIDSDHLVRVSDAGIDEASGSPFLVMELLRGEELGDMLERQKRLPPAEVVTYLSQASLALDKTHAANIVHRDIKPGNLIITRRDDGSPCVKILDFGIAKVVANDQHKTRALGTPLYMAPEQIRGEAAIGPRADLYSLAQMAYTLLTGEPYWSEEAKAEDSLYALLMKVVIGAMEPPTARALRRSGVRLPPAFDPWFFKATAANQGARFDRATAQTAALAEVLAGAPPPSLAYAPTALAPSPPTLPGTGNWSQAVPSVSGPVPSTLPSPGMAPPTGPGQADPLAPVVPVPVPPRSRALMIALVVVGGVLAVGLVLVGIALLGGGGGEAGSGLGSGFTPANCMPNATCVAIDVPDPTHVDAQTLLPVVLKLARGTDGKAVLSNIFVSDVGKDGTADLTTGDHQILYQFTVTGATISITVRKRTAIVMKTNPLPYSKNTPEPQCSMKAAYRAAVAAGVPPGPDRVSAMYSSNDVALNGVWTISGNKQSAMLDPRTCTVKR